MDLLTAAIVGPVIALVACGGEYLKLAGTKTKLDPQSIYKREKRISVLSILVTVLWSTYYFVTGKPLDTPAVLFAFSVGVYFGAWLWKENQGK